MVWGGIAPNVVLHIIAGFFGNLLLILYIDGSFSGACLGRYGAYLSEWVGAIPTLVSWFLALWIRALVSRWYISSMGVLFLVVSSGPIREMFLLASPRFLPPF